MGSEGSYYCGQHLEIGLMTCGRDLRCLRLGLAFRMFFRSDNYLVHYVIRKPHPSSLRAWRDTTRVWRSMADYCN